MGDRFQARIGDQDFPERVIRLGQNPHAARWCLQIRSPCEVVKPPKRRRVEMRVLDEEQTRLFLARQSVRVRTLGRPIGT